MRLDSDFVTFEIRNYNKSNFIAKIMKSIVKRRRYISNGNSHG